MKKIMFNDRHGLTRAVLDGSKTMTRRICKPQPLGDTMAGDPAFIRDYAPYKVGEIVAVAQPYKDLNYNHYNYATSPDHSYGIKRDYAEKQAGWNNKMFVSAKFMPHQIQITDIKVERLQDITDEDCLREGICEVEGAYCTFYCYGDIATRTIDFATPREAFASLINKVSGKGTWQSNPYVIAYSFQLLK